MGRTTATMLFRSIMLVAIALGTLQPAVAGKRVALVIGNAAYRHTPPLKNTRNDAGDIAAALGRLGFTVLKRTDLDRAGMDKAVRDFATALKGAEVGAFFYAGHALQYAGRNYLVPVDAKLTTEDALDFEMLRLQLIQRVMERKTKTNVIFLDACRDNPLSRNLARALGTRSTSMGQGLAQVEAGVGTLISYATQPGNVALDGQGRNSPYTAALKRHILTPGLDITSILIGVRVDVMKATGNKQIPWDQHALTARLVLTPGGANREPRAPHFYGPQTAASQPRDPKTSTMTTVPEQRLRIGEAARVWIRLGRTTRVEALEAFRKRYGKANPHYDRLAALRIELLRRRDAGSPGGAARACVTLGRDVAEPVKLSVGSTFCDAERRNTARVERIGNRAVVFSVNGGSHFTCQQGELCGFSWPVKPLFRIDARADRARGIAPRAIMLPR